MATTKVTTGGITDATIATADIADQAITLDKLPHGTSSNNGKFLRANNGADPTFETVTSTTINNNADDRIITGSGTANTLNGEANLTMNGNHLQFNTTANGHGVKIVSTGNYYNLLSFDSGNTSAGGELAYIDFKWDGDKVADIQVLAGSDTTNKDDGILAFRTSPSQGSITERMRIDQSGKVLVGATSSAAGQLIVKDTAGNQFWGIGRSSDGNASISFRNNADNAYNGRIAADDSTGMDFEVAGTQRMIIDRSGKVGINTDNNGPDRLLHVSDNNNTGVVTPLRISNVAGSSGTEVRMEFECGLDEVAYIGAKNAGSDIGPLMFATASSQGAYPTEKARLSSNGNWMVGTTSSSVSTQAKGISLNNDGAMISRRDGVMHYYKSISTGGYYALQFYSANTSVGNIFFNSGGTQFNTSSDYRRKENIVSLTNGISKLKQLKTYNFNFKDNPSVTLQGFLAHEAQEVVPHIVTGTKDQVATDEDVEKGVAQNIGDPIYQTIDHSKLVPLLTASLQELETRVAALEAA